jgi:hypothetical protein
MMGKTPKEKEEGTRILNNYKKQLAEKLAREKAAQDREGMSNHTYKKSSVFSGKTKGSGGRSAKSSKSSKKLHPSSGISDVEAMEPEVLLRILYGKGGAAATLGNTATSLNSKKF